MDGTEAVSKHTNTASVTGVVDHVLFHSPDTGYSILVVVHEDTDKRVTVVGSCAVDAGQWVTVTGRWITHPRYGLQIKADSIELSLPNTPSSIERYLGSGILPGIGPSLAKRIMQKFGVEAINVLDDDPSRIKTVKGVGAKRAEQIMEAWTAQRAYSRAALFLTSLGATQGQCARIWAAYNAKTVDIVTREPYRLINDIRGIGFPTADSFALALGVARDSLARTTAGLYYVVDRAVKWGSCGIPYDTVVRDVCKLLGIAPQSAQAALDGLLNAPDAKLVAEVVGHGKPCVFPQRLWVAETFIAREVRALCQSEPLWPHASADDVADILPPKVVDRLTREQLEGVWRMFVSKVSVLTGGPGTGKTATLDAALAAFHAHGLRVRLAAPTGKAAKRMQELTKHAASTVAKLIGDKDRAIDCDVLVLDEASMSDVAMLRAILKQANGRTSLVLVGDVDQLPSIGPGRVLSDLISAGTVPVTRLTKVFRQAAQSAIVRNAHRINHGLPLEATLPDGAPEPDFYFMAVPEPERIASTIMGLVTERIPAWLKVRPQDVQVLSPMHRTVTGVRALNEALQQAINPGPEAFTVRDGTRLGVGDRIIHTVNDYKLKVMNGETGVVREIDNKERTLLAEMGDQMVLYPFGSLDEVELAYATTIHKSQGSQYQAVIIPVTHQHHLMLQRSLIYTAVTRATRLCVLVGDPDALQYAVRNVREDKRITRLGGLLQAGVSIPTLDNAAEVERSESPASPAAARQPGRERERPAAVNW